MHVSKKHLSRQGKQLKNTISEEESCVVPNEVFPIYAVNMCVLTIDNKIQHLKIERLNDYRFSY